MVLIDLLLTHQDLVLPLAADIELVVLNRYLGEVALVRRDDLLAVILEGVHLLLAVAEQLRILRWVCHLLLVEDLKLELTIGALLHQLLPMPC